MKLAALDEVQAHYALGLEHARLDQPFGSVEFERTKAVVLRALPASPATVADVGGGPGRYAEWLAALGYRVLHRDVVVSHVEHVSQLRLDGVEAQVADARELDLGDESVDAVLLLGPLYHLKSRDDRVQALSETGRVVKPGSPVFAAAISRWAPRLHGLVSKRVYEDYSEALEVVDEIESDGWMPPLCEGMFSGYTHRPEEFAEEVRDAGLELVDLVGLEGLAFAFNDVDRFADARWRAVLLDAAEKLERVPELLGVSPHMVATARRPN